MDITKMTLPELKALAYDLIAQKETAEISLRAVNGEIGRLQAEELPADDKKDE